MKKRPASAAAVRDAAIDEAEQKRSRMQENVWALEKQVLYTAHAPVLLVIAGIAMMFSHPVAVDGSPSRLAV